MDRGSLPLDAQQNQHFQRNDQGFVESVDSVAPCGEEDQGNRFPSSMDSSPVRSSIPGSVRILVFHGTKNRFGTRFRAAGHRRRTSASFTKWSIRQVPFRCVSTPIQSGLLVGQALACLGCSLEPRQAKACPTINLPDAPLKLELNKIRLLGTNCGITSQCTCPGGLVGPIQGDKS